MMSQIFQYSVPDTSSIFDIPTSLSQVSQPQQLPQSIVPTSLDFDVPNPWLSKEPTYSVSKVILFKGIPEDLVEEEILCLCDSFGIIKDILLNKAKRYAYVQFDKIEQAQRCYESFKNFPTVVRNHPLYVFCTGKNDIIKPSNSITSPCRFLSLVFHNIGFNVDSNFINQLLAPYGRFVKIAFFQSKNSQVFVEMEDVSQAMTAKEALDGQTAFNNVYIGASYHDDKEIFQKVPFSNSYNTGISTAGTLDHLQLPSASKNLSFKTIWSETQESSDLWTTFGYLSENPSVKNTAPVNKPTEKSTKPKLYRFESDDAFPQDFTGLVTPSFNSLNHIKEEKSATILLVKNIPNGMTARMLFRLFGMYGNVLKVKIFFKNPENALVEYQTAEQAEFAKSYLNNCPLYGNNIFVTNSKQGVLVDVSALRKSQETQYMGNYLNSPEHRYKFNGSKNHLNIVPPSKVIHLSNLCDDKDEEFYKGLFKELGSVSKFMFMKGPEKMALMEMDSVESSVKILMNFHNFNINGKYLKVSFSKYQKVKDI